MNKKIVGVIFLICFQHLLNAQVSLPSYPDSLFSTYYWQRVTHFNTLPQSKDDIIFLGNSITDGAEWAELFQDDKIKNRGISGDITAGVIHRLKKITEGHPSEIFLLIGINDLARNIPVDSVVENILMISSYIRQQSPSTRLFVQSILPVSDFYKKFPTHTDKGKQIKQVNEQLERRATEYHYHFIDLYSSFCDEEGKLRSNLTNDGLHLKGEAYLLWKHIIYPCVYDLQQRPSVIPLPREIHFSKEFFPLYSARQIFISNDSLLVNAMQLQQQLQRIGINTEISLATANDDAPHIELRIKKITTPECEDEAYKLSVSSSKIIIAANTRHGIFDAIQTLLQLVRDNVIIDGCEIFDWPAYSWRGYMVDVGRNFQSMNLLKQQIDIMSCYKLNIFHFHFTEDIAWRLHSKLYPQLTAPENMLRNKGMYYSESDFTELISYCKERFITLVPEIDMPGHSAAFKRAMGVDMQSDSGLVIVKNILNEFCSTYNLPYMHIGGDEVHITNKDFMPAIVNMLHSLGKTTIAWSPGAKVDTATIRQLWMSDNGEKNKSSMTYIDSRHLYINHMDPFESVVTIFFRQIGDTVKQTTNLKGATLCLWPDRRVEYEEDILRMNPVYPAMLAFAERTWRGGGYKGWTATIGKPFTPKANEFAEFENRLLDHKKIYFKIVAFPYVRQTGIIWKLYGPYNNSGVLSKKFPIEENKAGSDSSSAKVVGATIFLRHWWYPLVSGCIKEPVENSTIYASTEIFSDEDKDVQCWIGFNDFSRSTATDSPPVGSWDNKESEIWVNGKSIAAPDWRRGGQKGNPEIPLFDEGYAYRPATEIHLNKGKNTILIKAPVGSFKGADWQNPVKWMFTFNILN